MVRSRRRALGIAIAVSALVAAPVVSPMAQAQAQEETTLRVALTQDIDTLNPFQAVFLSSTQIVRNMYEYLTQASKEDSSPVPALATEWEVADDNLTWTFTIRDGMKWSDGEPITAEDVAFTYNLIMTNPEAAEANGPAVANYESVEATDEHTLVIKTKQPQASMLTSDIPVVPEHIWAEHADSIGDVTNTGDIPLVGSGPFIVSEYKEADSVTMVANENFYRGRPKIDKLQFIKYEDLEPAVQGLLSDEVDMVFKLQPLQFQTLSKEENIATHAGRYRRYLEIVLNPSNPKATGETFGNGHPALKDVRVRKALHHAIDVDAIIKEVFGGNADKATGVIPSTFPDWQWHPEESQLRTFDLDEANRLLDEAGYPMDEEEGVRLDKNGEPLTFRLMGRNSEPQQQEIANRITEWYAQIGVQVTQIFASSNQVSDNFLAGNYDLGFTGWSVGGDPDFTLAQQTCEYVGTDLADADYCNPEYDELYKQQQAELDVEKRKQLVQDMQAMLYEDVSAIWLAYPTQLEAYRSDKFTGFDMQPSDGGVINNQSGYWAYFSATPVAGGGESGGGSGLGTGAVIAIVGGAVVLAAGVVFGVTRRRKTADERE